MCFSATANFVGAGVVGAVGVATLAQVHRPRELPFAALPALFALHQLDEAIVWLSLEGHLSHAVGQVAAYAYLLYAQGVLPLLFPAALLPIEPSTRRRWAVVPFPILGAVAGVYLFWVDAARPVSYSIRNNSIDYHNSGHWLGVFAVLYIIAVCGGALVSGYRWIIAFGVANLVGLSVVEILLARSFTSVWCAYAAVVSVLIWLFFHRQDRQQRDGVTVGSGEGEPRPARGWGQAAHRRHDRRRHMVWISANAIPVEITGYQSAPGKLVVPAPLPARLSHPFDGTIRRRVARSGLAGAH